MSQSSKNTTKKQPECKEKVNTEEQAKKQWEKVDVEGCKIINDLIVADKDRTIWPWKTQNQSLPERKEQN